MKKIAETELVVPWSTPVSCPLGTRLVAAVASICAISSMYHVGQVVYDAFFAVYVARPPFNLATSQIGGLLSCSACLSFFVSTMVFHRTQRRIGITATSVLGLCLIGTCLASVGHESCTLAFGVPFTRPHRFAFWVTEWCFVLDVALNFSMTSKAALWASGPRKIDSPQFQGWISG